MKADTNYIYIIFVMVYIIYSIIKARKKIVKNRPIIDKNPQHTTTQPHTNPHSPQPTVGDEFKKMMEQMLGEVPEVQVPEKQIQQPKHHQAKVTHTPLKEKLFTHKIKTETQQNSVLQEQEPVIDFDIRQAIISYEILKKPSY
ncbi:MAG: hypothetical protein V1781_08975 [Bacteroidota bacterium]